MVSSMTADYWKKELVTLQDKEFSTWACKGIQYGFHTGYANVLPYNYAQQKNNPGVVTKYIANELSSQHLLEGRPEAGHSYPNIHISPLGVIPKKGRANSWCMIMDLSAPPGQV